jgi:prevent-host-death family protein
MKKMAAGVFKVHCLAVMDEVQSKRQSVLITKRGKPVAKLVPADNDAKDDLFGLWPAKARSLAISSLLQLAPKNGAISIDSPGYACSGLACH